MVRQTLPLVAVAGHLVLTALHGLVHVAIPILPTGWIAAFAAVSLYGLPLVGAALIVTGHHRVGAIGLFGAGVASFVFEGAFHFLISNPDHIAYVADHHALFSLTAILTTVGNLLLVGAAWFSVQDTGQPENGISPLSSTE
ncbi:hypothetical protein [Halobaculum sp. D14]|uniref:hypothetical protein n=1 Tax=Halobaculum sp. D14 TaxID=3421642 RepID=UPI003EC0B759